MKDMQCHLYENTGRISFGITIFQLVLSRLQISPSHLNVNTQHYLLYIWIWDDNHASAWCMSSHLDFFSKLILLIHLHGL